jgi:hypothetical protein
MKNTYNTLMGKPEGREHLGLDVLINIKIYFKEGRMAQV